MQKSKGRGVGSSKCRIDRIPGNAERKMLFNGYVTAVFTSWGLGVAHQQLLEASQQSRHETVFLR